MSLDTYIPQPRILEIGGKSLALLPLRVRQLGPFSRAVEPVAGLLMAGDMLDAVRGGAEHIAAAVAIATDQDPAWVGDLYPDDLLRLVAAVMEINADFFTRAVTPLLLEIAAGMPNATPGATPSRSLPPTDTPLGSFATTA